MKVEKVEKNQNANASYFKSLANTRGSVSMMVMSWIGVILFALEVFAFYSYFDKGLRINPFSSYFFDFLLLYILYLIVTTILGFSSSFIYKKQIISTVMLLLSYVGIFISLQLLALMIMVTSVSTKEFVLGFPLYGPIAVPFILITTILCFIHNSVWLKNQLKKGFSVNRTIGNYLASSSGFSKKSLWFVFGISMLGGVLSGKFGIILGIILSVLFSYAFSQLILEIVYLLHLKIRDKEYWEEIPDNTGSFRDLFKGFNLKKTKVRILIEIFIYCLFFGVLYNLGYFQQNVNIPSWMIWSGRVGLLIIILDTVVSYAISKRKK